MTPTAILLVHCPDQTGLVATVTTFLAAHHANILDLDQHVDTSQNLFFMRVSWDLNGFSLSEAEFRSRFASDIAEPRQMTWSLYMDAPPPTFAVFVSHLPHCLVDLLGQFHAQIPVVVSNHERLGDVARRFDIPFHHVPVTADTKPQAEARQLEILREHGVEAVVLARYMQIVSPEFIARFPNRIINIHHSFLPAFPGAKPYHSAYHRGVKIIGATSHFVTAELDAGPIIEQDVVRVDHRDEIDDLVRKGRELEKLVLSRAVWGYSQRRILSVGNKTVVF
jgi:formyltetrahydrofolate deformylase